MHVSSGLIRDIPSSAIDSMEYHPGAHSGKNIRQVWIRNVEQIDTNPFFQSDVILFINAFLANSVKTKSTSHLKGKLDELNTKATEWLKIYKQ